MDNKEFKFAVVQQEVQVIPENIVLTGNTTYCSWGRDNRYPNFLFYNYLNCSTLQSIITGFVNFILGNDVLCNVLERPNPKQTWKQFLEELETDYLIFGIAYIQIIRANDGLSVSELYHIDSRFIRTDENEEIYYYNEDFAKKYTRVNKTIIYPRFKKGINVPSSIISIKTPISRDVYGTPVWQSAIKSVQTEVGIDEYHLSELNNNFSPSAMICFNNGIPSDEEKNEIEKLIKRKFTGAANTGRFLLSFANGKDNATTIERLATDDFDKRYESLAKRTKENIYAAFRANPQLFGNTIQAGFNSQDYQESFRIFQKTVIFPIQERLVDYIDYIFDVKGSVEIRPFAIDFTDADTVNNTEIVN